MARFQQFLQRLIDLVANVHHVFALPHRNTEGDRLDAIETNEVEGADPQVALRPERRRQASRCLLDLEGRCESLRGFNRTKRIADVEGRPAIFKIDERGSDADFAIEPVYHRIERNTQSDQRLMVEF